MSKINIEFDTVEKTLSVTKDGAVLTDICYATVYKSYEGDGKFCLSVESEQKDEEQKTATRTVIYASEKTQSEFAAAVAARYGL